MTLCQWQSPYQLVILKSLSKFDKPRGASPLTMCRNIVTLGVGWGWVGYWGAGGGWVDWKRGGMLCGLWIHRDVNPLQAANPNTAKDGPIASGTS
jgi:hypothetical protein